MNPEVVAAFFTGFASLLAVVFKQWMDIRKLKSAPKTVELPVVVDPAASVPAMQSTLPCAVLTLEGEFEWVSESFKKAVMDARTVFPSGLIGTRGENIMEASSMVVFNKARKTAMSEGAAVVWKSEWGYSIFMEVMDDKVVVKLFDYQ